MSRMQRNFKRNGLPVNDNAYSGDLVIARPTSISPPPAKIDRSHLRDQILKVYDQSKHVQMKIIQADDLGVSAVDGQGFVHLLDFDEADESPFTKIAGSIKQKSGYNGIDYRVS